MSVKSAPSGSLASVFRVTRPSQFQAGIPRPLFRVEHSSTGLRNSYVVSPDGQRFLMLVPADKGKPQPITVVVNWPALLKKQ
jgi:hypothetical protein